jgi:hypothetical protein
MFNSLQALQAFGLGQQVTAHRQQVRRADQEFQRTEAARGALGDWMTAPGAVPARPGGLNPTGTVPTSSTAAQLANVGQTATASPPMVQATAALDQFETGAQGAPPSAGSVPALMNLAMAATSPREEAFNRYARIDPEGAMRARRYEREERRGDTQATADELKLYSAVNEEQFNLLGGVTDQATWDDARERAADMAERFGLDAPDLPDEYSPEFVESARLSALSAKQRVDALRSNRKLDADIEDDEADNERADLETGSRIDYREGSLANQRERTRIARERPARPAARAPAARAPTKSTVEGRLLDKQARGQPLTPAETQVLASFRSTKGAETYPEGTVIEMPDGSTKVRKGNKWVAE